MTRLPPTTATRRQFLIVAGGAGLAPLLTPVPAGATADSMAAAIREVVGEATVSEGKVKLELPPLIENGNAVPLTVSVESAMTDADHVKAIHLFNEKNPQPNVASFHLGPRAGRPKISTRIRLADSQKVIAIAQMSDGSFWSDSVDVVVTLAACLEDSPP
jgi:sulfur-oxidizing protein SoxY